MGARGGGVTGASQGTGRARVVADRNMWWRRGRLVEAVGRFRSEVAFAREAERLSEVEAEYSAACGWLLEGIVVRVANPWRACSTSEQARYGFLTAA